MELHTARRLSSERQRALSEVASVRQRLNGAVNGVGAGGHRSGSDGTASFSAAPPLRRTPMAPAARPASQEVPEGADSPTLAATATLRRTLFTVLVLAQTAAFAYCMATKILPYHGREPLEIAILALSTILFVTATRDGKLHEGLPRYTHPGVLVIDEVGYLGYGPDAANVLFQVVNDRYLHHHPMILTTNKPLTAWGRVLHDPDLAEAILDRVLERGRHIELRGRSYRTRPAPLDLKPGPEPPSPAPARISGNHRPEFPEPTCGLHTRQAQCSPFCCIRGS